ncbi:MAG TPA: hypothetical protein VHE99_09920 [Gammaproteobacteria bacterium]|nr:hypothetical protein [Gammaproteobacteria bacterium]
MQDDAKEIELEKIADLDARGLERLIDNMDCHQFAHFNKAKAQEQIERYRQDLFAAINIRLEHNPSAQFHLKAKFLSKISDFFHDRGYDGLLEKDQYFQLGMRKLVEAYGKDTLRMPSSLTIRGTGEQAENFRILGKSIDSWLKPDTFLKSDTNNSSKSFEEDYPRVINTIKHSGLTDSQQYYLSLKALLARNEVQKTSGVSEKEATEQLSKGCDQLIRRFRDVPKTSFSVCNSFLKDQPKRDVSDTPLSSRSSTTGTYARIQSATSSSKEQLLSSMAAARTRGKAKLKEEEAAELVAYSAERSSPDSYKDMFKAAIESSLLSYEREFKDRITKEIASSSSPNESETKQITAKVKSEMEEKRRSATWMAPDTEELVNSPSSLSRN